jgi:uncharacterized protein YfaS (alpha-2-macroglobulin family)
MRNRLPAAAALLLAVLVLTGFGFFSRSDEPLPPRGGGDALLVVDAAHREFDGAPALALSFSQPLDKRSGYDRYLRVYEMPLRATDPAPRELQHDGDEPFDPWSSDPALSTQTSSTAADTDATGGRPVPGAWVVGDNPRLLFFPNVKPQTRYVVQVQAGLPGAGGRRLAAAAHYSVRTAAVAPAYYFASRGMVLPARQNGGLPVVTVNVPEVDVQFLRVKPDQLPRFLDRVISPPRPKGARRPSAEDEEESYSNDPLRARGLRGAVAHWDLDTLHRMTDSVYAGRFVTERRPNRRAVTFLPVEEIKALAEPGIYIAVMSQPNRFRYEQQVSYFYVSDLGLHLRSFAPGADAYLSSLTDGRALRGVEVSWLDADGRVLARAETDGDGRATFAERPTNARLLLARKGAQLSLITLKEPALDLSEYEITGAPYKPVRLFPYAGRDLYRPGERFELSILARDADGRPVPAQPVQAQLKRPDGKTQFTQTWAAPPGLPGFSRGRIEVPADAPTGFWTLELRIDPADKQPSASFRFSVEEFLPERMKLELKAEPANPGPKDALTVAIQGSYLYGAPAAGNRLLAVAQFERNRNPLAQKLPGFEFGDSGEDSVKARKELPEATLDERGAAVLAVDTEPAAARRSPFTVRTTVSLLESGGRPVVRSIERVLWPAPALIGVRPLFDGDYAPENAPAGFEVVRADAAGTLSAATALPVRLFRENRDYYWRFEDQRGWHSGFTETDELVDTGAVTLPAGGRGRLTVPVRYGRYRLEIFDPETRQTLRYRFYAGWSARNDEEQGLRPDRVALKLDKPAYADGETALLSITPPHAGEALVTIEADRTLWVKRLALPKEGGTVSLPIDKEWRRHDLYVSVLVLRPGAAGAKVTPARALGIVPLPLAREARKLAVTLEAPQKMQPEQPLKVRLRVPQAAGQSALVTVSAVDLGILNITRYAAPDPHGAFFGRLRYGADQHDLYGRLIEKMDGSRGKLKFGGDAAVPKTTRGLPQKVRLVDLFSGPVALDAQGNAEVTLPVPDFNGTLRLMAVAATADAFGAQQAEVVVAAPLVAELATPRFLTVGDTASIALDLTNLSGAAQTLKVAVRADRGLKIAQPERRLTLAHNGRSTLRFAVDASEAFGLSDLRVQVDAGNGLKLERRFGLEIIAAAPRQQTVRYLSVDPGRTLELKEADLAGYLPATVQAHLALSAQPPLDVRSAIQGLLRYPYGCAEQTTSTTYPHLFIDEDSARRFGLTPFTPAQRSEMVGRSLGRLAAMQAPNGGFSLWGGGGEYEYWLSAYVSNFLLDARAQGFEVPAAMYDRAQAFLLKGLQEGVATLPAGAPDPNSVWADRYYAGGARFGVLAYGGYVLARESKAPLATLRQLYEARGGAHSGLALLQLGLALRLMGDETRSNTAINEGLGKSRLAGGWWGDYGSPLRDAALGYALLQQHELRPAERGRLLAVIAAELRERRQRYFSTQEQMALFLVGRGLLAAPAGSAWNAELLAGKPAALSSRSTEFVPLEAKPLAQGLKLRNTGTVPLFAELVVSGHPAQPPALRSDALSLQRDLFGADGKPLGARPLRVGDSVLVRITAGTRYRIANGMVVDRIPAGLEIENLSLVQGESLGSVLIDGVNPAQAMGDPRIRHVEFRDDRFVAAVRFDWAPLVLFYRARVVTPGRFVVPPLYAEDMYQPDLWGSAAGGGTLVIQDGQSQ